MDKRNEIDSYVSHFGNVMFHYSILGFVLASSLILSVFLFPLVITLALLVMLLYYVFLIMTTIFTMGILWLAEEYRYLWSDKGISILTNVSDNAAIIIPKIIDAIPYVSFISIGICIISLVCLCLSKRVNDKTGKIVTLSIFMFLLLALALITIFAKPLLTGGVS